MVPNDLIRRNQAAGGHLHGGKLLVTRVDLSLAMQWGLHGVQVPRYHLQNQTTCIYYGGHFHGGKVLMTRLDLSHAWLLSSWLPRPVGWIIRNPP